MAEIEIFGEHCFLVRGHLSPREQTRLFAHVEDNDCTPWDSLPRVMNPGPKTLLFGQHKDPKMNYKLGDGSSVADMVGRAISIIQKDRSASPLGEQLNANAVKSLTMAAIRYLAPDARFPPHVDHCSNSFVFLASLGCTAKFMVKCSADGELHKFDFNRGDLLVFDASTAAAVLHGVMGVRERSCDVDELLDQFPILKNHRYGVQCRLTFEQP